MKYLKHLLYLTILLLAVAPGARGPVHRADRFRQRQDADLEAVSGHYFDPTKAGTGMNLDFGTLVGGTVDQVFITTSATRRTARRSTTSSAVATRAPIPSWRGRARASSGSCRRGHRHDQRQ